MPSRLLASLIAGLFAATSTQALADDAVARLDFQLRHPASNESPASEDSPAAIEQEPAARTEVRQQWLNRDQLQQASGDQSADAIEHEDIWTRIRAGFVIPDIESPLVEKWENYYSSRPDYLNRIMERGNRYLHHIVTELDRRGMPMELALLPIVESAYNPRAESHAAAAGMWQFIPSTGKHYGLERTWWYDGRRDVIAATDAALNYLGTLHGMFDDWQLALASYNWGENAVKRALARNEAAGLSMAYIDLRMPDETRNYVPKLLAIRNIIANPEAFGVTLKPIPNQPYFATLQPGRHMDVKVAAQLAEISVDELLKLNPGFIRPVIAHKSDRQLVLPIDKVATFERNLAAYDKPLLNWQPYVAKAGDSIDSLAGKFGITSSELRDINELGSGTRLAGRTILVPKVDHLDVSDRQTLAALKENSQTEPLDTGERDTVRQAVVRAPRVTTREAAPARHTVGRGETLFGIARRYGLTVEQIQASNGLRSTRLSAGQVLKLEGVSQREARRMLARSGQEARSRSESTRRYVVRRGDTYSSIAQRFKVETSDLLRWNGASRRSVLQPGDKLVIND